MNQPVEQRAAWLASVETLVKSLDFLGPSVLPPSFRRDILEPVKSQLSNARTIADELIFSGIKDRIIRDADDTLHRPWHFWTQLVQLLAEYLRADRVIVFHAPRPRTWMRVHPPLAEGEEERDIEALVSAREVSGGPHAAQEVAISWTGGNQAAYAFCAQSTGHLPKIRQDRSAIVRSQIPHLTPVMDRFLPKLEPNRSWVAFQPSHSSDQDAEIIGSDPRFLDSLRALDQAATSDASVFLRGESGTGKELFARRLHQGSRRSKGPFIAINCSAVPHELIESEMFGHEKGAFTGAYYRKIGRVEQAHGGTFFLDEIGEMPLAFQAKLLRYLQEKSFTRVGGTSPVRSDARIVVATHRDLKELVASKAFREDLYYRIHVIPIEIPPLRDRGRDIRILTEFFFNKYISRSRASRRRVDETVFQCLENYAFPGNVRELENIVQRTVVMAKKNKITLRDLPDDVRAGEKTRDLPEIRLHPFDKFDQFIPTDRDALRELKQEIDHIASTYVRDLERRFLLNLLHQGDGSARKAAELAGINRTLFYKLLKRAGIEISVLSKEEP